MKNIARIFRKWILLFFLFACLLLVPSQSTTAQTENDLSFVYGTNHFNGATYSSAMVPPSIHNMYLLANETSMVAARFTEIYYWQITNEYKANWDKANINVDGTLEILQKDKVIQNVQRTYYVIQYDYFDKLGTIKLYLGQEAIDARKHFEDEQAQYRDDLYNYYKELNTYQQEFQKALQKLQNGEIDESQMPQPPEPLEDLSLFSTDLLQGFPVNLPQGEYTIRLRLPDGTIQPDSEKHLVVFASLQDGIGYNIAAEERWNKPEQSNDTSEVIYSIKNETLYVQPVQQKQYNQLYYERMNNPQNKTASQERTVWVPFKEMKTYTLQITCEGAPQRIPIEDYFVQQRSGAKLGYDIVPFDPQNMDKPTFTAFKVTVPDNDSVCYWVSVDSQGTEVPKSQRELRVLNTQNSQMVYLISIFPIILGFIVSFLRRKQVRNIKVSEG